MVVRKKLIEVALPLKVINAASALEKQPFTRRHPRSIHIWWARRPLVAARAVLFAQLVDDPSSLPDLFPTEKAQDKERKRLFKIIEDLVLWENTTNEEVLERAREEIRQSWRRACADNADHPEAEKLFNRDVLPAFHDPFAGGGTLPIEAQRLGLEAHASDLNPVAVLINTALIEIPSRFASVAPVNPEIRLDHALIRQEWVGASGLAEDIRFYGQWMRDEAKKRISHLYPQVEITAEFAASRPDLSQYVGGRLNVIAWLWARTVKSPNPAFADVEVPLVSTFILSKKQGRLAQVEPIVEPGGYRFVVNTGEPKNAAASKAGTRHGAGANFRCIMSGSPISAQYVREQGKAGRIGSRLMAIVAEGSRERVYLAPSSAQETAADVPEPLWAPEVEFFQQALGFRVGNYGMSRWSDLYTDRQLVTLSTFAALVEETRIRIRQDAMEAGMIDDGTRLHCGGIGSEAYADAIAVYLGIATSRWSDMSNALCSWNNVNQNVRALFSRQAIPMNWDFCELSPFSSVGPWFSTVESIVSATKSLATTTRGYASQADAADQGVTSGKVVSTDPPYYDNIGYADLSDFFYVWLRRALGRVYPSLFATVVTPKAEELVATPHRHGGKDAAEAFFLKGMSQAMRQLSRQSHPAFPTTVYYAFKQMERDKGGGTTSTGWEAFLGALSRAGFGVTGTWPIRTERDSRSRGLESNALASSIVLVCRPVPDNAPMATRRELVAQLKHDLPEALRYLKSSNIAPVDLAQAAIGPGMAVFTRYSKVLDAAGEAMTIHEALTLINQALDEALAEEEGTFDADTRWALAWFEQSAFAHGDFGVAEVLTKAKVTSVNGLVGAGIVESKRGKVRLLRPDELPANWDPTTDSRLTAWEIVHHLVRAMKIGGESAAASIVAKLGSKTETARELAYRLYALCERKKRAAEALSYNALVQSWPEIVRIARETRSAEPVQRELL